MHPMSGVGERKPRKPQPGDTTLLYLCSQILISISFQ
uniref:Uncharacterized protein n=1 Tax=Rhizophora mucronata TaxID=61149 RepID=A0A2P2NBA5_RHIMU